METIVWAKIGSSLIHKYRLAEHSTFKSILPGTYLNQRLVITCRFSRVVTSFSKQLFVTIWLVPKPVTTDADLHFCIRCKLIFCFVQKELKIMRVRILFFTNYRKSRYKQERQPCMYKSTKYWLEDCRFLPIRAFIVL